MKRIKRSPERFEVLDLFARLSRERGIDVTDASAPADFARLLSDALQNIRGEPIAIHGRRIQEMFAYVAASLGQTLMVKAEDAGDIIASEPDLAIPDYRLVLADQSQILVEVKNSHTASPTTPLRLAPQYVARLSRYSSLVKTPVFIAVYWSRWNLWTLTPLNAAPPKALTLLEGTLRNHMHLLGDKLIGTTPPLVLRVVADPEEPCLLEKDGSCSFRIGAVEYFCAGKPVRGSMERKVAFQLMLFGKWPEARTDAQLDGDKVIHFDMVFEPDEPVSAQPFQMIGSLSTMISGHFQLMTTKDRAITALSPAAEPGSLAVPIPPGYRSDELPLWMLIQSPGTQGGT